jgi:hypothetical protein
MKKLESHNIIALDHFIQATRDAGYKSITSALAELVDNSFEAGAQNVDIEFSKSEAGEITVTVGDDGCGMTPSVIRLALQFGGSTRFDSRQGIGRYGMGLPNSSLSQARRVDVFTWRKKKSIWWSYLDIDEIIERNLADVPTPKRYKNSLMKNPRRSETGTIVIWSNCDRIEYKSELKFLADIERELGRLFRKHLWLGKRIYLCGKPIRPVDPLFLRKGANLVGALPFGPPLYYEVEVSKPGVKRQRAAVIVNFVELPIEDWHDLSNEQKRSFGISKRAGVSIVRAGREIDYGWFFMGKKRKENYDDWWRCEISFDPILDELFGVTNTKQGIRPTETLINILSPDIERVAHELNSRVRKRYFSVKANLTTSGGQFQASSRDYLLEPPTRAFYAEKSQSGGRLPLPHIIPGVKRSPVPGLYYRIEHKRMDELSFFTPLLAPRELVVLLNEDHPFYECVYTPYVRSSNPNIKGLYKLLELVILAAARAECSVSPTDSQCLIKRMREEWGKALATFLE